MYDAHATWAACPLPRTWFVFQAHHHGSCLLQMQPCRPALAPSPCLGMLGRTLGSIVSMEPDLLRVQIELNRIRLVSKGVRG